MLLRTFLCHVLVRSVVVRCVLCLVVLGRSASAPHSPLPPVGGVQLSVWPSAVALSSAQLRSELRPRTVALEAPLLSHTEPPAAAHGLSRRSGSGGDKVYPAGTMAAKDDLYSKIIPRRLRQNRPGSVKCGSSLDVLLSMGFPRPRA